MKNLLSVLFAGLFAVASTAALAQDKKAEPTKDAAKTTEVKKDDVKKPEAKKDDKKTTDAKTTDAKKKEKKGGC
jgi:Ni/Co efflux regulator RcnB